MGKEDDVDFIFYDKKKVELEELLAMAKSRTMRDLITEAIDRTEAAMRDLLVIQQVVVQYLTAYNARYTKRFNGIKKDIDAISKPIRDIRTASLTKDQAIPATVLKHAASAIEASFHKNEKMKILVNETHQKTARALYDTLLQYIFKYSTKDFNSDRIYELFNYFLESKTPGLGELKLVMNMPAKARRKKMVKDGDELPTYLEQYNDVLEKWSHYGAEYMRILISNPSDLVVPD